jgi:acetyl coenzyme A synthetase (ADP forming)-like protein
MLPALLSPKSVALIGASGTPGKLGFDILANLIELGFAGEIYPVNPKGGVLLGKKAYPSVSAIEASVDLAVIAVPAAIVLDVVEECGNKGIQNIVIISAGFKESGQEGKEREEKLHELIEKYDLCLIGPNCLGILNPHAALNASFAEGMPKKGNIALISQSGAMAVAILDWATEENIGFSSIVSLGNKAGVNENDLLVYLEQDAATKVILLYLESFVDGQKFMQEAERISQKKPIIVFKSGISTAGQKAVSSHTGSLAGSNTAIDAALKQTGVLRANTIEDFFDAARVFSMEPLPKGSNVAIITNAGGPGVIATDAVSTSKILSMATFSEKTEQELQKVLPPTANIHNPIDVIGDALADRYQGALEQVCQDPNVDMVLTILTPQIMTEKENTVRALVNVHELFPELPFVTSFMGGKNIAYAAEKLAERGIPNFLFPGRAVESLEKMVELRTWREKQARKKEKITARSDLQIWQDAIQKEIAAGRTQLSPELGQNLLKAFNIPVPTLQIVENREAAVVAAEKMGYPVVLKIAAAEVLHKTEVGGVRLALKNGQEVGDGYEEIISNVRKHFPNLPAYPVLVQKMYHFGREVIIGMKRDPIFGPLIMFGLGGIYVEVMKDVAFRVAPFDRETALEMIHEVKAIRLLEGVRGEAPADIEKLADTVLALSELALSFPAIEEFDINPLLVLSEGKGVVAIDMRFLVNNSEK